jgi:translation initiation factor IF-1
MDFHFLKQSNTASGALQCSSRFKLEYDSECAERRAQPGAVLSLGVFVRLMLPFAFAAIFVLAGVMLDGNYQRSTPEATYVQGTVVGFERPHAKQVYPIFEFKDAGGRLHRVVNSSQQAIVRLAAGDAVPIAYSQSDPQRARIDTFWFNHRWVVGGFIVALTLVFGTLIRRQSGFA